MVVGDSMQHCFFMFFDNVFWDALHSHMSIEDMIEGWRMLSWEFCKGFEAFCEPNLFISQKEIMQH